MIRVTRVITFKLKKRRVDMRAMGASGTVAVIEKWLNRCYNQPSMSGFSVHEDMDDFVRNELTLRVTFNHNIGVEVGVETGR